MSFVLLGILNSQAAGGVAPAFLSSAPLWLDAADASTITESGGSVSQWDNKGTLENFSQATSADQPTTGANTLNGLNVLDFDSDFLTGSTKSQWKFLHDGTEYFFAIVAKAGNVASPSSSYTYFGGESTTGSSGALFRYSSNDAFRYEIFCNVAGTRALFLVDDNFITPNTFQIQSALLDPDNGTVANQIDYFTNDTEGVEESTQNEPVSTSDPNENLSIGGSGNSGTTPFVGSIAELIIVSGADATEANRQEVVDYLNAKWAVF